MLAMDPCVEIRPGWSVRFHPAAYRFFTTSQYADPDQILEFDGFISTTRPGMTLFDIGAHFGMFSLAALHYGGPNARVVSVDPSPTVVRMMRIQAMLNRVADRLCVVDACVGDREGSHDMVAVGVLGAGFFVPPEQHHVATELTSTPMVTLDGLAERFNVVPTHIKIDVEGEEAAVLRGGPRVLSSPDSPLLFLELHNELARRIGRDPEAALEILERYGYDTLSATGVPITASAILDVPIARIVARKGI